MAPKVQDSCILKKNAMKQRNKQTKNQEKTKKIFSEKCKNLDYFLAYISM